MSTNNPKKPGEGRKKSVKFTREVKDYILNKMKEGMTLLEVCKKHKSEVPSYEHILETALKDHEFNLELNDAYGIMLMRKMDILQETAAIPPTQLYPELDWREASETKRSIVDVQKFLLGKLAPVLSSRFQKQDKLEVTGIDTGPKMAVINYYLESDKQVATSCSQTMSARQLTTTINQIPQLLDSYTVNTED